MTRPRIHLFSLGGTIAMVPGEGGTGVRPDLDGVALLEAVPQIAAIADLSVTDFARVGSANLDFGHALALADAIRHRLRAGADGIVVTQGTDTLEEMALALDLLLDEEMPVVVTGAMRHPRLPGADGPANLLAAVVVAASADVRGHGVLVAMNDEVHAARYVRKGHTASTAAFISPSLGPLGHIYENRVFLAARIPRTPTFGLEPGAKMPSVALIPAVFGGDGRMFDLVGQGGFDGLVVEAFGAGHMPEPIADILGGLARKIPVVLASRVGGGRILEQTYGYKGAEIDLIDRGLVPAGLWDGRKARILLTFLLAKGSSDEQIRQTFSDAC